MTLPRTTSPCQASLTRRNVTLQSADLPLLSYHPSPQQIDNGRNDMKRGIRVVRYVDLAMDPVPAE